VVREGGDKRFHEAEHDKMLANALYTVFLRRNRLFIEVLKPEPRPTGFNLRFGVARRKDQLTGDDTVPEAY
jgi:hypothetical protein